jgi:Flp pilus assembly protein TadD
MNTLTRFIVLALATGQLAACQTTGTNSPDMNGRMNAAYEKASKKANSGDTTVPLAVAEKQYKKNPEDAAAALTYAKALRQSDYANQAATILMPFAREKEALPGVKSEMAAIQLALGNFDAAEEYGQQAVLQDPTDARAYQDLGIALDAKQMHPEAERAFRKALENWQGDPTVIMNNLALNLASQGFVDEAIEVLEKAKELSPGRIEIERNLRIVRTMNER